MPVGPNVGIVIALSLSFAIVVAWRVIEIAMGW